MYWQQKPQAGNTDAVHTCTQKTRSLWIHDQDIAQIDVPQVLPPNLWLHSDQAIRDTVGQPYRWERTNKTPGRKSHKAQDAVLGSPLVDVWNHHMRRDSSDACTAIPRFVDEWPVLSDEQIEHESQMPNLDKAADVAQMNRLWNAPRYAPQRAVPSRYKANQSSQSSGSQQSKALISRDQRHWNRQTNTNAGWGGRSSGSQQTGHVPTTRGGSSAQWWPQC